MKIVQGDTLEWKRGLQHRGGMFHYRNLMEGQAGTIDNFQLSMGRSDKDFLSPRHRHNFDQFRFQLEGELKFGRDGTMKPGMVGYFPEGAHYGPQTQDDEALTIVLQFGGASGHGYLSRSEVQQGMKELEKFGTFKDGVYRRNEDVEGKRNMDGYQAIWEHARGRAMEYPKPRYDGPIMMDQASFFWTPSASEKGVFEKSLGAFTERRAGAGLLRIEAGASSRLPGRSIHVCVSGQGKIGDEAVRSFTTIYLPPNEECEVIATEEITMIRMLLPDLTGLEIEQQAVAAE